MSYTALYRKFRPNSFSEMVGQEHITKTLRNQIKADRVGHAYLMCGGRGTGKTTSAKILARAINCLNPQDGEPCNECEICKEILNGSLTDVVEMDAASNNSVDDIRGIRDEVNFLPTKAKYRVYIIDEVHMLSTGAFNALLKTLEEPPEHVKFILATTEPQKLPATILSRCQRFDFKKISEEDVVHRLSIIAEESKIEITKEALKMIAILSEGAMRDAISILERCMQDTDQEITADKIKELVGLPSTEKIYQITKAIAEYDEITAITVLEEVISQGKDLYHFLWELVKYIKDILICKSHGTLDLYNEQEKMQMQEIAEKVTKERLFQIISYLSELDQNIKWAAQKNVILQAGIIRLCYKQEYQDIESLMRRVEDLEKKIQNISAQGVITPSNVTPASNIKKEQKISNQTEKKQTVTNTTKASSVSFSKGTEELWKNVLNYLRSHGKISLYTNLIGTKAAMINDLVMEIIFPNGMTPFGKTVLEKPDNKRELENIVTQLACKEIHIRFSENKQEETGKASPIQDLGIDIHIID